MADVGLPLAAIRDQVADAIDLSSGRSARPTGTRRIVEVAEVVRIAGGPGVRELYALRAGRPSWRAAARGHQGGPARGRRPMSQAAWLRRRAAAAAAGVAGAWEALAAIERTRVAAAAARVLEPLARAGREGRTPTAPERRRLRAVAAARCSSRAGWSAARRSGCSPRSRGRSCSSA